MVPRGRAKSRNPGRPKKAAQSQADNVAQSDYGSAGPIERNGSESHSVTTPTTTPGQYREVRPESNTEEGNTHAKDYLKWFGSLVQQHRAIRVIVFLLSVWYFVDWLEKYTGFYLFTNYQNVGIWTHQLQEHLLWTVILGFAVLWYFSSVQYLLLCVLVVFVLPRIVYRLNRKFGIY